MLPSPPTAKGFWAIETGLPFESISPGDARRGIVGRWLVRRQDEGLVVVCPFVDSLGVEERIEGGPQRFAAWGGTKGLEHRLEESIMDPPVGIAQGEHLQAIGQDRDVADGTVEAIKSDMAIEVR